MSTTNSELINAGIFMGVIHVLTGPDHLSSMATLSGMNILQRQKSSGKRGRRSSQSEAFLLGIKWGIGHSLVLLGGGSILILVKGTESTGMDYKLSMAFEWVVAIFMLALGCYGLHVAFRNKRETNSRAAVRAAAADGLQIGFRRNKRRSNHMSQASSEESLAEISLVEGRSKSSHAKTTKIEAQKEPPLAAPKNKRESVSSVMSGQSSLIAHMESVLDEDDADEEDIDFLIMQAAGVAPEQIHSQKTEADEEQDGDVEDGIIWPSLKQSGSGLADSFSRIVKSSTRPLSSSFKRILKKNSLPDTIPEDTNEDAIFQTKERGEWCFAKFCRSFWSTTPNSILAFITGLVHGLASLGAVLGILPAMIQYHDALIYMSVFCLTSTLFMGGFAALYRRFCDWMLAIENGGGNSSQSVGTGGLSSPSYADSSTVVSNVGSIVFMVEVGSASLSLVVGVIWVVLLSIGGMDEMLL